MGLRPLAFSIPSTTELKVTFSEKLFPALTSSNFEVESLNGSARDLEVVGITISENVVLIKIRPQVAGNYYLLKFIDTSETDFKSEKGARLFDDQVSRELFFVGIDNVNPIRDRMYRLVPDLFELEGSVLKNVLSAQAEEIYKVQKKIGSTLSNNYISETVTDEVRTRTGGAYDRFANENAFEIVRVSDKLTGESLKAHTIKFNSSFSDIRMDIMPVYPVPLQQVVIEDEEISVSSVSNNFEGFLLTLSKKNVTRLLSVLLVKNDDIADCDGNVGMLYNVEKYKYAIKDNRYDQDFSFSMNSLESNQILLSEFGNLDRPSIYDKIYVSYAYKDLGRNILSDEIEVSRVESVSNESVPSNAVSFFLKNAPIVNSSNKVYTSKGLTFSVSENNNAVPDEFKKEIVFNAARLPSFPGEWSCNYETGEVFVFGAEASPEGTGRNNYIVGYSYRKEFKEDLDYSISGQDIVATPDRDLAKKEVDIFIKYDKVFAEGVDYEFSSHIEVMPEFVKNKLNTSFSITTNKGPITNVFRILNQTTGEVYNPIYFSDYEIFFSGGRSPEIKVKENEKAYFKNIRNEKLLVVGEFIAPVHTAKITSKTSNSNIQFSPGIPSELISVYSDQYFVREISFNNEEYDVEDTQIKFFGTPDSGGLITSFGINPSATAPSVGTEFIIGPRSFVINLDNELILNKNDDTLGSFVNSSFQPSNKNIFKNERYFEPILINSELKGTSSGGLSQAFVGEKDSSFYTNLSRLRTIGDYVVDYRYGIVYLAVNIDKDTDLSHAHYTCAIHKTSGKNILTVSAASKKKKISDSAVDAVINYSKQTNTESEIYLNDIENGLTIYDGKTEAPDLSDTLSTICEVRSDYTIVVPHDILGISAIFKRTDLIGLNLNASDQSDRIQESDLEDLLLLVKNGGKNLYDPNSTTFSKNVIDLKKVVQKRAYKNNDGDFEITIIDNNVGEFIKCKKATGNMQTVDDPTITYLENGLKIIISSSYSFSNGEKFEITYLPEGVPAPATPMVIDYRYGFHFFDYTFVHDEIVVWYEYGDNAIDWSISDTLSEGDSYFVTYKYGALRSALRRNFGSVTDIPFFTTFPIEVNRELYRNALKGTLQAFPKGPTVPAFQELIKSFTDIEPKIEELSFGNWILNRDYISADSIHYDGVLNFQNGKFGSGLYIDEQTTLSIPAISSLPLDEGTLECWIRPDWDGVANDATLTFDLENIGKDKLSVNQKENPFNKGFEIYPKSTAIGGTDITGAGTTIFNYRGDSSESSGIKQGKFGIIKEYDNLNELVSSDIRATIDIKSFGLSFNNLKNDFTIFSSFSLSSFLTFDSNKNVGIDLALTLIEDFDYEVSDVTFNDEEIENFDPPYPSRKCSCTFVNIQKNLANINDLEIEIVLDSVFDNSELNFELLEKGYQTLVVGDSEGYLYEVTGIYDENDKLISSIKSEIKKITVKKIPLNYSSLTTQWTDDINSLRPSGSLALYVKTINLSVVNYLNSFNAFGNKDKIVYDWGSETEYRILREPKSNLVTLFLKDKVYKYFYTDFETSTNSKKGFVFGSFDESILSEFVIKKLRGHIQNIFSTSNIYIGPTSYNPKRIPFEISKDNDIFNTVGIPKNIEKDEGIFIWFDELAKNPFSEEKGQWVFRTKAKRTELVPNDVIVNGYEDYEILYHSKFVNKAFSGNIYTDGQFGSVAKTYKDNGSYSSGPICSSSFRYCANELLENYGWNKLEETSSDLINVVLTGTQTEKSSWIKHGNFNTSVSKGIYHIGPSIHDYKCIEDSLDGNVLYTKVPCPGGNIEYSVSLKVEDSIDTSDSETGLFSGFISGNLNGIVPIHLNDGEINIKIALGISTSDDEVVLVLDGETNSIIDIVSYVWNDGLYHQYLVLKDKVNDKVNFYIDDILLSQSSIDEFDRPTISSNSIFSEEYIALHLLDGTLVLSEDAVLIGENILDIDSIFFSGNYTEGISELETTDILVSTDDRVQFSFSIDELDYDGYDGYDGYGESASIDEILISSDKKRYLVDSGKQEGSNRFSIFKDGKGFLNFRIYDNSLSKGNDSSYYNVSSNIKHFKAGELHHVAVSWKVNSIEEQDEMHLFIDGKETSNIYKFGGKIPVAINDKFSDVSKESLQNFLVKDIQYCELHTDGTTVANSSVFTSEEASFTSDMIGRSIIVTNSSIYDSLIGMELIISSFIDSNRVTLATGDGLNTVIFTTSANDIEFKLAPFAGLNSPILTDLKNNRFVIKRTDVSGDIEELGGILYTVNSGNISIIEGDKVYEPKFRANVDTRIVEFVGRGDDCLYSQTVFPNDLNIHIETLGLNLENCKFIIDLSQSSYSTSSDYTSGYSVLRTRSSEPVSLSDISITKIVLPRTGLDIIDPTEVGDNRFLTSFSLEFEDTSSLTSESGRVIKSQNLGRLLEVRFESDNVSYCNYTLDDGYQDGYQDGQVGTITIYGETVDGIDEETFFIGRNGNFAGTKYFKNVSRVKGTFEVVDEDYFELGVLEIRELNPITVSDNNGERANIDDYRNGTFFFSVNGSGGSVPFELHKGYYAVEYPSFLSIRIPEVGEKLHIGTDFNSSQHFGGVIDEFRIISEKSSDTRTTELETTGTRSVTEDFNKSIPFCKNSQTTALIHFNDPIDRQIKKLKTLKFLNEEENYSYSLTRKELESLLPYVNDSERFVFKMINLGYKEDDAIKAYYEVHKTEGGPLWNDSSYYRNYSEYIESSSSVNSNFGNSGLFKNGNSLSILNNSGEFRTKEGTIEFWVSPNIDTRVDAEKKYYIDISSASRDRVKSTSSTIIKLPSKAKKVISVKLLTSSKEEEIYYSEEEKNKILFDEISRNSISGVLEGGTGCEKDFGVGSVLSIDGSRILLSESLPGEKVDVLVTYIPLESTGDRVSIFKDENNFLKFYISANKVEHLVSYEIKWAKNSWHRVMCTYKTNSNGYDSMRIFVDGNEFAKITYGSGIIYGTGHVYGEIDQTESSFKNKNYNINLGNDLRIISIGSDIFGDSNIRGRMDNIRFSRIIRPTTLNSNGNYIDLNYSSNLNSVNPVVFDDATTYLQNFDADLEKIDKFATIIDPENGIFEFDVNVIDNFDKVIGVNDGQIEDLIDDLVERLKPAHSNAVVRFIKTKC